MYGQPPEEVRSAMQNAMQKHAAVFRSNASLQEGVQKIDKISIDMRSVSIKDKSLIFNTDLITPNIILPTRNEKSGRMSKLMFLNNDFESYDEIILRDGKSEIEVKAIGRKDNFSEFYVLGVNNVIYVFNSNNNLISKIEDLKDTNAIVDDFEVFTRPEL